ncbi:hypothetical protein U1Q18_052610 [Sarracenia purpurea var. burkii]
MLAKEFQHRQGATFMPSDNGRSYTGPITRSRTQAMLAHSSDESSIFNQQCDALQNEDHLMKDSPKKRKKSSQQLLKERYEAKDPEVGLLGESSGKFDFYVLYS